MSNKISISRDFSEYPSLRYISLSESSAEKFYHTILNKQFANSFLNNIPLIVDLDGTAGYTSSFLDEAFGNLVYDFGLKSVQKTLQFKSIEEPYWITMIEKETFLQWESRRKQGKSPKITQDHPAWYRLVNEELQLKVWCNVRS